MKKLLKIALCMLVAVGLVACGGGESTDAQKAVVDNFFSAIKKGDIETLTSLCTDDNSDIDVFTQVSAAFEIFEDEETYGSAVCDAAKAFVAEMFDKLIDSYEITSIEKDEDNYVATVSLKMRDFSSVTSDVNSWSTEMNNYATEHKTELAKIIQEKGQTAALEELYKNTIIPAMQELQGKLGSVETQDITTKVTLTQDGENWKISKIQ